MKNKKLLVLATLAVAALAVGAFAPTTVVTQAFADNNNSNNSNNPPVTATGGNNNNNNPGCKPGHPVSCGATPQPNP